MENYIKERKKENRLMEWFNQLKGWHPANYWLLGLAMGFQLMVYVSAPITPLSTITVLSTLMGVLCILAINATKSINGVFGIISALGFCYISFTAKNYLAICEQIAYICTLDIPILLSTNSWNKDTVKKIRTFGFQEWVISLVFTAVVWLLSSSLISHLTNDPRPIIDGMSFAICLTAGIICFLRYNNQYFWWLASGIAQLVLWFVSFKQGDASMAMFLSSSVYVLNDVIAFTVSPWFNKKEKQRLINANK